MYEVVRMTRTTPQQGKRVCDGHKKLRAKPWDEVRDLFGASSPPR